ncbi:MAG: hypothetical protein N4A74_21985 [Carboxylicivirga sp.]|jgi:hypothetical protein|nr:hypothetical protein [Carboxylicivirga sp.]
MKGSIELLRIAAVILITFTHTRHDIEDGPFYILFEYIPPYGTPILSIISGYLFWTKTRFKKNIFNSKVASLIIPYFVANIVVLLPVLIAKSLGFDYLNRLEYDYTLLTEGLLSLNSPPINPPTYFIRDLFVLFVILELLFKRNLKMLLIIIPLVVFGEFILRFDIVIMFFWGCVISKYEHKIKLLLAIQLNIFIATLLIEPNFIKFSIAGLIFSALLKYKIQVPKVGGYTYLLHLYHSPIMVFSYPVLAIFIHNTKINAILQVTLSLIFVGLLFFTTLRIKPLRILSGHRD